VTPDDMISRGKGLSPTAVAELPADSPAKQAFEEFKVLVQRRNDAVQLGEELTEERNQEVYKLKNEHNIGFTAMAEVLDVSSSMVLYIHERAQGKTAKQIREESVRSRIAKEQFLESDPNRKSARKQTPAEKELRKRQRDELKAFLDAQREAGVDVGDADPDQPVYDDEEDGDT
jgi:anaerobic ribonucleoside-triphosphate reductase